ncbi:MAG: cyclic lactone autoinducer peptide [Oscillospiraceae bacterium]|nr:cyclic lactone autoinducer peptide [Oscillospiraceae bacterium]
MKKLRELTTRFGGTLAALALMVGVDAVGAGCLLFFHQPKVPQGMSKYVGKKTSKKQ